MTDLFKIFEIYSLKARVFPALIAIFPIILFLFFTVPWTDIGLPQVLVISLSSTLLFAFSDIARRQGKRIEEKLNIGATPELWYHSNTVIANGSKKRYQKYIEKKIKIPAPTTKHEGKKDPEKENDFYIAANNWLREQTRDQSRFSILFSENITYGFRRNLLGLKVISLLLDTIIFFSCISIIYFQPAYFAHLTKIDEKIIIVMIVVVLHLLYMLFVITVEALRKASQTYGRQLILSCETLMESMPAAPHAIIQAGVKNNVDH